MEQHKCKGVLVFEQAGGTHSYSSTCYGLNTSQPEADAVDLLQHHEVRNMGLASSKYAVRSRSYCRRSHFLVNQAAVIFPHDLCKSIKQHCLNACNICCGGAAESSSCNP
jgi:hypothetical protein